MTGRQAFALERPIDPKDVDGLIRFAKTLTRGTMKFGTILTVDRREGLWWHVSVSVLSLQFKPVPMNQITPAERAAADRLAKELLDGVGEPDSGEMMIDEMSLQIIRKVTAEEGRQKR